MVTSLLRPKRDEERSDHGEAAKHICLIDVSSDRLSCELFTFARWCGSAGHQFSLDLFEVAAVWRQGRFDRQTRSARFSIKNRIKLHAQRSAMPRSTHLKSELMAKFT